MPSPAEPLALPLAWLQRWMQDLVLHPVPRDGDAGAPERARLRAELTPRLLSASDRQSAEERLDVYRRMVALRFESTLALDHPVLAAALGDGRFAHLSRDYLAAAPSTSFTLDRLADRLPEFVRGWDGVSGSEPARLADLALLEKGLRETAQAAPSRGLDPAALAAIPAEAWPSARFRLAPSLRLLGFGTAAEAAFDAWSDGRPAAPAPDAPTHLALVRRADGVERIRLSRSGRDFLAALAAGATLGEAMAGEDGASLVSPRRLGRWLERWVRGGVFEEVAVRPSPPKEPR